MRERANGPDRQRLLRRPDGSAHGRDHRRIGRRQSADTWSAEWPLRSRAAEGLTTLKDYDSGKTQYNASVQLATDIGDTVKRIDGTEVPLLAPWKGGPTAKTTTAKPAAKKAAAKPAAAKAAPKAKVAAPAKAPAKAAPKAAAAPATTAATAEKKPRTMTAPRKSGADDLKLISGVGPKLEIVLNEIGFWHFDQVSKWTATEIAWVDSRLKFKGRIERDNWVDQATELAKK